MRTLAFALFLLACKTDAPPPARTEAPRAAGITPARRATLPAMTSTNALAIHVQLRAERAWDDASRDNTPEAWDLAAELFARSRDACRRDCTELAYSVVLARSNAIKADPAIVRPEDRPTTPQPLPPRVEAMIEASDAYVAMAPATDPERPGVEFLAGNQYNSFGWIDESTQRFEAIIHAHPTHDVSLYSANLMLDAFNRTQRYDDMLHWARELSQNAAMMAAHPELANLVAQLLSRR